MKYSNRPNAYINAKDLEIAMVKATTYGDALKALRDAPIIDIVRCEMCKYSDHCEHAVLIAEFCGEVEEAREIDFCSYGER